MGQNQTGKENRGTGRVYGTNLFAMVDGKLQTVGNLIKRPAEIFPFQHYVNGTVVDFPYMKRSN